MSNWSPYFSYPDGSFNAGWTGGINFDLQPLSASESTFPATCNDAYSAGPSATAWSSGRMRLLQDVGSAPYIVGQLFIHLDFFAFVHNLSDDAPDYPFPYPDAQILAIEPETNHTASFVDLAARFHRFRFTFDLIDAADITGLNPIDIDAWVRPWHPSELAYGTLGLYPVGSYPIGRFASASDLASLPNYVATGGHLAASSGAATVTTSDILPIDFLDLTPHSDINGQAQFLCFTVAFAAQVSHTPPGGSSWGRSVRLGDVSLDAAWGRDRFRFQLAARPPLAHRQRLDGTDTAGPQLAQIGAAGGRPQLAWRQHTP